MHNVCSVCSVTSIFMFRPAHPHIHQCLMHSNHLVFPPPILVFLHIHEVLCYVLWHFMPSFLSGIYHAWQCYICALARACVPIVKLIIFQLYTHLIFSEHLPDICYSKTYRTSLSDLTDISRPMKIARVSDVGRCRLSMTSERLWVLADPWPMSAMAGPWLSYWWCTQTKK